MPRVLVKKLSSLPLLPDCDVDHRRGALLEPSATTVLERQTQVCGITHLAGRRITERYICKRPVLSVQSRPDDRTFPITHEKIDQYTDADERCEPSCESWMLGRKVDQPVY